MRGAFCIASFIGLVCCPFFVANAQECQSFVVRNEVGVQKFVPTEPELVKGWKRVTVPNRLSVLLPSNFVVEESFTVDGPRLIAQSDDYKLFADFNTSAYAPDAIQVRGPSYCEWLSWIDGAFAYFWNFKRSEEPTKYQSGIYFQFLEDPNYRMSLYIESSSQHSQDFAEKIFKSVTFLRKPRE